MSSTNFLNASHCRRLVEAYDREPLLWWGKRVGNDARKASPYLSQLLPALRGDVASRSKSPVAFFGANSPGHCFREPDSDWLWLHEPQITKAFVSFLARGEASHVLAFLKALESECDWPTDVNELRVEAEMPTRKGFVDILVKYRSGGELYGAVIEAKFGHDAKANPFSDYRRIAKKEVFEGNDKNVIYRILGQKPCKRTSRLVARPDNPWRFVSWFAFLRRLEFELADAPIIEPFQRFRRIVWERIL